MGYNTSFSLSSDLIEQWEAVPKFQRSALVQRLLREEFSGSTTKISKKKVNKLIINSNAVEKVNKSNPDINLVIGTWKEVLGEPDGTQAENRRYAKLLIDKRGLERAVGAIKAVAPIKGKKFSPKITCIKHLYYKWGDLEDFYQRKKADDEDPDRELTQEELNKEFGL